MYLYTQYLTYEHFFFAPFSLYLSACMDLFGQGKVMYTPLTFLTMMDISVPLYSLSLLCLSTVESDRQLDFLEFIY